uniref:Ribosomal protein n=1 Tax=Eustigmatophyceae sp. Mont 10/10-1w TaxID=2506145 RepID=A0A451FMR2_9STRA|nr:ribosomal protein L1 [Eustigmatophyceae sp. Mont 10/10-1w]QAA11703.1 ribosomal protein L1 [Eustigmatophyceae sp. Mont 10/10-1w]
MKRVSKRFAAAKKFIEPKTYTIEEALELVQKTATAKFTESVEAHICLNVNPKYADQQLRSTVILPAGTGKTVRVVAITSVDSGLSAQQLGADRVGSEELIEEINQGYTDFDVLIAEPEMMSKLAKLGRILGPKGLMPSPKAGTVTKDIASAVKQFKQGKIEYRVDKTGIVHLNFGKVNFTTPQLLENFLAIYKSIVQNKPSGVKGRYFKNLYLCSSMGPSVEIDLTSL